MIKNAFWKDGLRQIRATMNRFLAILIITALGVAFFAGLRASGPDMRITASEYFDRLNFMDIRLVSTIGFNEDDLTAVRSVEGVHSVMPAYSYDALAQLPDQNLTIRLHSLPEDKNEVNLPELIQGRMPVSSGECLADPRFMELSGYKIGDRVRFISGTSHPISDALKIDSFQIVGIGKSPLYISDERGASTVGGGKTDAYFLILPTDFAFTVYTEVYLTVQNKDSVSRFDDAYVDLLEPVKTALEETGALRAGLRYEAIKDEAGQELDNGKRELKNGYRELDDAKKEIGAARAVLDDGWRKYYDGLEKYNQEIAGAQGDLAAGQAELEQGWQKYNEGRTEFEQRTAAAEKKLADGYAEYEKGLQEYEQGLSQYQRGIEEFNQAEQELEAGEAAYNQGYAEYTRGQELYGTLTAALESGNTPEGLAAIGMIASEIGGTNPQLAAVLTAYVQNPEDPMTIAAAQGAVQQFGQTLAASKRQLDAARAELDSGRAQLEASRQELSAAAAKLNAAKEELEAAKEQLDQGSVELEQARLEGQRELSDARNKLLDAEKELADGKATFEKEKVQGKQELESAIQGLNDGEAEFINGQNEFLTKQADALKELADAQREIDDGEKQLAELKMPEWYVLDLNTNIGFAGYKQDAQRIDAISLIIPILFFLVAVLVTMTSMTRLVDSDRSYIGTFKAMGYGNSRIAMRYLFYAVTASLIGSVAGLIAGFNIFPRVIFNAYASLYTLPPIQIQFNLTYAFISVILAVACAALPAYLVCIRSMREAPAELIRPAAPSVGKRTLLERASIIWNKFNFSQKVAIRNLFRYKKRLIMTVIGVAGCTALMFTGFGLRDSITTIMPKQYDTIQKFDLQIDLKQDIPVADKASLDEALKNEGDILSKTELTNQSVEALQDASLEPAFLIVPEMPAEFTDFVGFQDRETQQSLKLKGDSVIVTEKLADLLDLEVGSSFTIRDDDGKTATVVVGGITENYLYHYIYMAPALYQSAFKAEPIVNQVLCHLQDASGTSNDVLSESLLTHPAVSAVTFTKDLQSGGGKMIGALDYVVLVLVLSAAALVFVVLFSLTTINLEERNRELATIKVLGFFNRELAAYLYRENVVLTIIGTLAGLLLGVVLQRYIIATMAVDMLMFSRDLLWQSYVYSAGLTLLFAMLVNIIMLRHIAKIDMISSLKSIE